MSTLIHFIAIPALIILKTQKSKYEDQILPPIRAYKTRLESLPLLSPSSLLANPNVKDVLLEGIIGVNQNNCLKYRKKEGIEFSKKHLIRHIKINNSDAKHTDEPKNNEVIIQKDHQKDLKNGKTSNDKVGFHNLPSHDPKQKAGGNSDTEKNQDDNQGKTSNPIVLPPNYLPDNETLPSPNLALLYKLKTTAIKNNLEDFFFFANNKLPKHILEIKKKFVPFFVCDYEDPSITIPIEGSRILQDEHRALKFIDFYKKGYANEGFFHRKTSKAQGIKIMGVEEGQYVTILGRIRGSGGSMVFLGEKMFDSRRKELERVEREERVARNHINVLENGFYLGCSLYIAYIIHSLN
jgi:hypothetical protein